MQKLFNVFRAGRKTGPGNITIVEAAEDSAVKKIGNANEGTTLLIPTLTGASVTQKFVAPLTKKIIFILLLLGHAGK